MAYMIRTTAKDFELFYGPFASAQAAARWAHTVLGDRGWVIQPLIEPGEDVG